jgi:hypothetical protein
MYRSLMACSYRCRSLACGDLGDLAGARQAIALSEGVSSRTNEDWFQTACVHAALASLAGRDGSGISAAEAASEADTAMFLLRKVVAMVFGAARRCAG